MVQQMSNIRRDFVVSQLRIHINRLHDMLAVLETAEDIECGYAQESLKDIETGLRKVRHVCAE